MITVYNFVIEATRKCMLNCAHCLRGDSMPVSFSAFADLELFLKQGVYINHLTFSGGEPFLVPNTLIKIIQLMLKHKTHVEQIYIATSGVIPKNPNHLGDIIIALREMMKLLNIEDINLWYDEEFSPLLIELSNSEYHIEAREQQGHTVEPLLVLLAKKDHRKYDCKALVPLGRAEYMSANYTKYDVLYHSCQRGLVIEKDDDGIQIDEIYVTYNGHCFPECDLSYEMMDNAVSYDFKVVTLGMLSEMIKKS